MGLAVLLGCVAAALVALWIVFQLYAPRRSRVAVRAYRSSTQVIVEPALVARKAPSPPRSRLARGTGATVSRPARADSTEKIVRRDVYAR